MTRYWTHRSFALLFSVVDRTWRADRAPACRRTVDPMPVQRLTPVRIPLEDVLPQLARAPVLVVPVAEGRQSALVEPAW